MFVHAAWDWRQFAAGLEGPTARRLTWAVAGSAGFHLLVLANMTMAPAWSTSSATVDLPLSVRFAEEASSLVVEPPTPIPSPIRIPETQPDREPSRPVPAPVEAASTALPSIDEVFYAGRDVDERAMPLKEVELRYPEAALKSGISGAVKMRLRIDSRGELRDATVLESVPPGVFDEEAMRAVQSLKFRPAIRRGVAVGSVKLIEIPFYPDCLRTGSCTR